jgi:KDO2-lipid IV(A) lauroyltransferase
METSDADWKLIETALERGNGVILMTGHIGCFDFLGQAFVAKGYPLTIVTGRTTSRFIFDGVTYLRSSHGNSLVEPTPSGVRHSYRALRRNGITVIVTDRDFFQNGKPVEFFGKKTTLPPGAVRIARDTGATVVPVITKRIGQGRHRMSLLTPFTIEKTTDVDRDIDEGMQKVARVLEDCIRDNVDQWAMFQRVWPDQAPDPVRVFPVGSPLESPLLERVASALPERRTTPREKSPGVVTRVRGWIGSRINRNG